MSNQTRHWPRIEFLSSKSQESQRRGLAATFHLGGSSRILQDKHVEKYKCYTRCDGDTSLNDAEVFCEHNSGIYNLHFWQEETFHDRILELENGPEVSVI